MRSLHGEYSGGLVAQGKTIVVALQALERLVLLQRRLTPLLTPRIRLDDRFVYLHWFDSCRWTGLLPSEVPGRLA